ncbi:MAG: YncE family protein, partial [Chloroflexota bacterium]|nr:YncE family protein [Chloroflexota bacterium]
MGPSDSLRLRRLATITGGLSPKSVVSSQTGYFFAQNMMYRHTVGVYDREFRLVKTIRDRVDLSEFGLATERTVVQGSPVEAAITPDGRSVYISQYTMYGSGYDRPGADTCYPAEQRDPSFVYRIDIASLAIDQVLPVGATPKHLAVSPNGRRLLVANWCSYDLSVFDLETLQEIRRILIGPYPRGITFSPDSRTAYIAVMGSTWIGVLDMQTLELGRIKN